MITEELVVVPDGVDGWFVVFPVVDKGGLVVLNAVVTDAGGVKDAVGREVTLACVAETGVVALLCSVVALPDEMLAGAILRVVGQNKT